MTSVKTAESDRYDIDTLSKASQTHSSPEFRSTNGQKAEQLLFMLDLLHVYVELVVGVDGYRNNAPAQMILTVVFSTEPWLQREESILHKGNPVYTDC